MKKINSIEWHQENLKNQKDYYKLESLKFLELTKKIQDLEKSIKDYEYQITSAVKIKLNEFDARKYKRHNGRVIIK